MGFVFSETGAAPCRLLGQRLAAWSHGGGALMIPALGFRLELVLRETNASEFVLQVRVLPETSVAWASKFS